MPDDGRRARVGLHLGGQTPVEVELVDGECPQLHQRAAARAEVVDGGADAESAQLPDRVARAVGIGCQRVLEELQGERRRGKAVAFQGGGDLARQVQVGEVGGPSSSDGVALLSKPVTRSARMPLLSVQLTDEQRALLSLHGGGR